MGARLGTSRPSISEKPVVVYPWPPFGWRLARGEGPAKAEFEAHMRRAKAIEDAWRQRPRRRTR